MHTPSHSLTDLLFDYAAPDTPKSGAKQQSESLNLAVQQWVLRNLCFQKETLIPLNHHMVIITIPKSKPNVNDFQNSFNNLLIINKRFCAFLLIMTTLFWSKKVFSFYSFCKA
jgi:hypothetical protein